MRKIRCLKFFSFGVRIGARFMFYMTLLLAIGYIYGLKFNPEMEISNPYPFLDAAGMAALISFVCYLLAFCAKRVADDCESRLRSVSQLPDNNLDA